MKFTPTKIPDVIEITPTVFTDQRGYFMETFQQEKFEKFMSQRDPFGRKKINFCQENESKSVKNTLRGLHYQLPPFAQSKLVRVIEGKVLDIAVDLRKNSPTFGKYIAVELSAEKKNQLFIPQGFAHGFLVLSKTAIFSYKVDNTYSPEHERGILFSDSDLGIDWGKYGDEKNFLLSEKDLVQPLLKGGEVFEDKKINYI